MKKDIVQAKLVRTIFFDKSCIVDNTINRESHRAYDIIEKNNNSFIYKKLNLCSTIAEIFYSAIAAEYFDIPAVQNFLGIKTTTKNQQFGKGVLSADFSNKQVSQETFTKYLKMKNPLMYLETFRRKNCLAIDIENIIQYQIMKENTMRFCQQFLYSAFCNNTDFNTTNLMFLDGQLGPMYDFEGSANFARENTPKEETDNRFLNNQIFKNNLKIVRRIAPEIYEKFYSDLYTFFSDASSLFNFNELGLRLDKSKCGINNEEQCSVIGKLAKTKTEQHCTDLLSVLKA